MKPKKTIQISFIKDKINKAITEKEFPLNTDQKEILCTFLEIILLNTNNYKGFMFEDNNNSEILTNGYFTRKYF